LIYGAIVLAHKERDSCPVHIEAGRKRIPLYGPLHFDKGVFAAAEQHQTHRVMTVYFDKVGVQLDPATKRAFGSG
jgi:hypothetical protein